MDVTQKVEINKQKANEETNSVPQLGALEEDDEFEEFEVDDWRDDECEVSNMATNDKLWQDSWDDDDQDDDFSHQLRAELQKTGGDMNMST
ncbi:26S proteasome complex subunit SEM1 [Wallemia ichthyophaga EXF-994]|uniref:26S proteasome complex subunit SEM1 n=1 Tax=Wallemia ichthyophaga (strain EXF-994 / CBS 113033) TaxID=1299270 RepID=R9AGC0_WALI9|nr:26S proteasome complex subunit SEM1 [Wallemia ichthyophaga EXF-994]EOQ99110.1 26S proteasome complex subunit SEM1 [Wallemia ichthyophaga EXF-994]